MPPSAKPLLGKAKSTSKSLTTPQTTNRNNPPSSRRGTAAATTAAKAGKAGSSKALDALPGISETETPAPPVKADAKTPTRAPAGTRAPAAAAAAATAAPSRSRGPGHSFKAVTSGMTSIIDFVEETGGAGMDQFLKGKGADEAADAASEGAAGGSGAPRQAWTCKGLSLIHI